MTENFEISIGYKTDVGQQRSHNEDTLSVFDLPGAQAAFVVCDGMGGLRAGEVASGEAARVIESSLRASFTADGVPRDPKVILRTALSQANDAVNALNANTVIVQSGGGDSDDPTLRGNGSSTTVAATPANGLMGTTCVAGIVLSNTLYLAHAGDSRAYLLRTGTLTQVTEDHSYVADRVRAGDITEAEARTSRFRNVITRAIGIDPKLDPDVSELPLAEGDSLLVCSDGLTTMVEDPQIGDTLRSPAIARAKPERAAAALVDLANRNGGNDNITVLIVKVGSSNPEMASAAPASERPRPASGASKAAARGRIVDIDAPRRAGGMSPIGLLVFGALLAIIGLSSVLLFVPGARGHAARLLLQGQDVAAEGPAAAGAAPDYRTLTYDPPAPFGDLLARGDLLAYSRDGGLYFVRDGTGAVMALSKAGTHLHNAVTSVEALASSKTAATLATHIFMTSDPQGNVYLSYTKNRVIVKIDPSGKVLQTIGGFDHPEAIALDEAGNIYVVDFSLIKIVRVHSAAAAKTAPPSAAAAASSADHASPGSPSASKSAAPGVSAPKKAGG